MTTYSEEVTYYEARVDDLRRGQLKAVQTTATRWSALMAALLGVFGTVAFAGGLSTVDALPPVLGTVVRALTTTAAVAAVVAIAVLSRAAGGLDLRDLPNLNGKILMNREVVLVAEARRRIGVGKWFSMTAVALVLAGSATVLWARPAGSSQQLIVRFDDAVYCDSPRLDGGRLTVRGRDLREAVDVIPVSACPPAKRQ